jgi:uncharacterized protein YkwD
MQDARLKGGNIRYLIFNIKNLSTMHQALNTKLVLLVFSLIILTSSVHKGPPATPSVCLSAEEKKLYDLINEYRKQNKLPAIPLSKSLTYVAQQHCKDLQINKPHLKNGCNMHSWSNKGKWTSCCYTPDHKEKECMWNKPKELTSYTDNGFEISMGSSGTYSGGDLEINVRAEEALESWKGSVHHNDVILNKGIWSSKWGAIGIGIYKGYSTVWFGNSSDGEPAPVLCK